MSARITILLDGRAVAMAEPYDAIQAFDLQHPLESGNHELAIEAVGVAGPSAVFLSLDLRLEDGSQQQIVTDKTWQDAKANAVSSRGPIDPRLVVPIARRVGIDVVDNYEQWKQALGSPEGTDPASFFVAPGFEIRRVRSALPEEDSWVSLAVDPQGRVVIAKEQQGLLRMTLSPDGREVQDVEVVNDTLKECRGLAFIGEDLFANANNSKGLYRLRPLAGDKGDRFAPPELVYESAGGVGHGRNDLAVGGDGKLYSIHGDSVDLPATAVDYTSPFRDAKRGKKTSEGHLLRISPESGEVELLAAGLRNPFGIDFNRDGEIFTYDADAEYDMGSPWYRPTRVSHLVTGGDYGWRGVTKSWPAYYPDHPDNARPNLDIGKGSPTAVQFGTRSHFPRPYRDALFILDWAYGRIIAVHMVPRGSSYLMAAETFLKGRPLNVTDLAFAADGSMLLVTGGRKTQSALYRVQYIGSRDEKETPPALQQAAERFAKTSRQLRRQFEAWLGQPPDPNRLDRAWRSLSDPDPWIQHAAVNVLEHHPLSMWQSRALTETHITTAIQTLTSLARSGKDEVHPAILRRLNELLPRVALPTDKLSALYTYWLCLQAIDKTDAIDDALHQSTRAALSAEYPSRSRLGNSYPHNRLLSEMLVQLKSDDVVAKTIGLLREAPNQTSQMHYLYVLRNVTEGWTMDDRRAYFSALQQSRHYLGGAGMSEFLQRIREEAVATLSPTERRQLGSMLEETQAVDEVVPSEPRPLVKKWTVSELLAPEDPPSERDRSRGREMFAQASCVHCHRFGTRGTLIGPDLTDVSRRFNRRDLLVSIVEPSRVIAENYRSLQILTTDGRTFLGQATLGGDYRSPVLRLSTNPKQPFQSIEIPKQEIESQRLSEISWMPQGLLDTFTREEILDLVAYLESSP